MAEAEIPRLAEADFTASLRQGALALEVVAEDKIPAAYWKPQPPKLDKQGLLTALKSGTEIEGKRQPDAGQSAQCAEHRATHGRPKTDQQPR